MFCNCHAVRLVHVATCLTVVWLSQAHVTFLWFPSSLFTLVWSKFPGHTKYDSNAHVTLVCLSHYLVTLAWLSHSCVSLTSQMWHWCDSPSHVPVMTLTFNFPCGTCATCILHMWRAGDSNVTLTIPCESFLWLMCFLVSYVHSCVTLTDLMWHSCPWHLCDSHIACKTNVKSHTSSIFLKCEETLITSVRKWKSVRKENYNVIILKSVFSR